MMVPIDFGGYFENPGGTGWSQFDVPGATLPTVAITPPPNATGMLIYSSGAGFPFLFSPSATGGPGMQLATGKFLFVASREAIYQFAFDPSNAFSVQFYAGDGSGPAIYITADGGAGGGVAGVTALLPITSTGGINPEIALTDGEDFGRMLQWDGEAWVQVTGVGNSIWVDALFGDDETGQPYNQFRPFQSMDAAIAMASSDINFRSTIIGVGSYNYEISSAITKPVIIKCQYLTGASTPGGALLFSSAVPAVVFAETINSPVTLQGTSGVRIYANIPYALSVQSGTAICINSTIDSIVISGGQVSADKSIVGPVTISGSSIIRGINSSFHSIVGSGTLNLEGCTFREPPTGSFTFLSGTTGNVGLFAQTITIPIGTVVDGTMRLLKFGQPTTILKAVVQSDAGTTILAAKIGGTPITGLGAIAIGTTESSATATAANEAAEGDYLSFTFSSTASATGVTITIYYHEIVP